MMFRRLGFLCILGIGWTWAGAAHGQLSAKDIEALQQRARDEHWTFTVGENEATKRPLSQLCGYKRPPDWRKGARFVEMKHTRGLPSSYDWRAHNGCPAVRDQGQCGSCWAFGTVGPLECAILIKDGIEVDLSEQWLVSCNRSGWGCGGGFEAFDYFMATGGKTDACGGSGAVMEEDFPYTATDAPCNCPYDHPYTIRSWAYVASASEIPPVADIKQAILDYGPVSVAMSANEFFQGYTGGVYGGGACYSHDVNHQVVLVGWDDTMGTNGVWIMRNSWGTTWGDHGYMYIEYGCSEIGYGTCFIEYEAADMMQVAPYASLSSAGSLGGPFSPSTQTYTVSNGGSSIFFWQANKTQDWITLSATEDTLLPGQFTPVEVSINSQANSLPMGNYTDTITFTDVTTGHTTTRRVNLEVEPPTFYSEPLNTSPGWTTQGAWAFGTPQGFEGDPTAGHTGTNVYGYNLFGSYPDDMPLQSLTTTAIDCRGRMDIRLQFWRWLGVESSSYDQASVRVSNDGVNWTTLWQNPRSGTYDTSWVKCTYDVSEVADNQPTVYVQWRMGPSDSLFSFCGWNIDDLKLMGLALGDLYVTPKKGLKGSGYEGGPFAPIATDYTLTNLSAAPLTWHATKTQDWLSVTPSSHTLSPGAQETVQVAFNAQSRSLPYGVYTDTVAFTDESTSIVQTRNVELRVMSEMGAGEYFTEMFSEGCDLQFLTLKLTPDASDAGYKPCLKPAGAFPTDPAPGTPLALSDDNFVMVTLSGGKRVTLYGTSYDAFYVGSNGYITFTVGDYNFFPSIPDHFSMPRISACFDDLLPPDGGRATWQQLADRAVVTFEHVPEFSIFGGGPLVNFQVEMFFDGTIQITWLAVEVPYAVMGVSKGMGTPADLEPSDISAYPACENVGDQFVFTSLPAGGWQEVGNTCTLSVAFTGTIGIVKIQWTKDGEDIPGATDSAYEIDSLIPYDQGVYTCKVIDEAKAVHETPPIWIQVFPANSLPAPGIAGLAAGIVASLVTSLVLLRRRR